MSEHLKCNVYNCNVFLNGHAWVTRCLHVFCHEHGTHYFRNNRVQVNCPVCNEVIVQESDTLFSHTNPGDMILAGVRPEKILKLVEKSFKLWKYQLEVEKNHESSKVKEASRQLAEITLNFKRINQKKELEHNGQVVALQANYNEAIRQLKEVNRELEANQKALRKYKIAYGKIANSRSSPLLHTAVQANFDQEHNIFDETSSGGSLFGINQILKDLETI